MSSPSTLMRRARAAVKAGKPNTAKRLRAQAAKLRREARKTPLTKKLEGYLGRKLPKSVEPTGPAFIWPENLKPLVMARRNPDSEFLASATAVIEKERERERHKVSIEMSEAEHQRIKTIHEVHHIQVVAAFMAEIEGLQRASGNGVLPPLVTISGFAISRVYSALRDAGFTREGKGGINRETIRRAAPALAREGWTTAENAKAKGLIDVG